MTIDRPGSHQIPALRLLWQEAFGDSDEFLEEFFTAAYAPERCRCVTRDGRVAAGLYWFDCSCHGAKFAYIYAVATAACCRGQGLCHELIAQTHSHLARMGYAGAILVPGELGLRRLYASMGYRLCSKMREFSCHPAEVPVTVNPIGPARYACRRAALLPEGGVVQEGENLEFLAGFARLYEGSDWVLACRVEDGVVNGLELLGNTEAAPGIVTALRASAGRFRTPGTGRDFAMFCPLISNCPQPDYFGLAFD